MSNPEAFLPPGFRFHPTDEELILHYLKNRATSTPCPVSIIAEVDIYKFDPWNLPSKAMFGDREWYFFSPRDRKYPNGMRPNRAARSGYWKATGTDKPIATGKENIGVKKALVFYTGKPPRGTKTNWIMHEYRLVDSPNKIHHHMLPKTRDSSMRLDDWVLCRIYQKSSNLSSSSDTPAVDREDSNIEEMYSSGFPDVTQHTNNDSKLPMLGSFPELMEDVDYSSLSRLLSDNPADFSWQEPVGFDHQPNFHDNVPSLSGSLRRQRTPELYSDMSVAFNSSYKRQKSSDTPTNLDNQMDNLSYINHHMLMNSHLGFH